MKVCEGYSRIGLHYSLIRLEGDWAIYEGVHPDRESRNYEIRRVLRNEDGTLKAEGVKGLGSNWGRNAWTKMTLEGAEALLLEKLE